MPFIPKQNHPRKPDPRLEGWSPEQLREVERMLIKKSERFSAFIDRVERHYKKKLPASLREHWLSVEERSDKVKKFEALIGEVRTLEEYAAGFMNIGLNIEKNLTAGTDESTDDLRVLCASYLSLTSKNPDGTSIKHPRYQVSLGLAQRLAFTSLRGVKAKDIRLPFSHIRVELPAAFDEALDIGSIAEPRVLIVKEETPGGVALKAGMERSLLMSLIPLRMENEMNRDPSIIFGRLVFREEWTWQQALEHSTSVFYSIDDRLGTAEHAKLYTPLGGIEACERLYNLIGNLILFATSSKTRESATNKEYIELTRRIEAIKGQSSKKDRLKERRRSLDPEYKIVLGVNVRPVPEEVRGERGKIGVRTLVSGHWRNQVRGPAKRYSDETHRMEWIPAQERLHEWTWIQPFWRGAELSEDAPTTAPIRVMKELTVKLAKEGSAGGDRLAGTGEAVKEALDGDQVVSEGAQPVRVPAEDIPRDGGVAV